MAPGYAHVAQADLGKRLEEEAALIQRGEVPEVTRTSVETYERALARVETNVSDAEFEDWLALEAGLRATGAPFRGPAR